MKMIPEWLLLAAVQILSFLLLADSGWMLGNAFYGRLRGGAGDGMAFYFAHHLFVGLAIAHSLILWRWPSHRVLVPSALLCSALFGLYFAPVWASHPYRSLMMMGLGTLCFGLPLLVRHWGMARSARALRP